MHVELPLDQMTIVDKLEVMETLWASLSLHPQELPSPDWHREVLVERKQMADEGRLRFIDWESAIADLKEELRLD